MSSPTARIQEPEPTDRTESARRVLSRIARCANVLVACIVVAVLVGWIGNYEVLRTFGADFPSLQVPTAILILMAAGALAAVQREGRAAQRVARLGTGIIALSAVLVLIGHAMGVHVGTDLGLSFLRASATELPAPVPVATAVTLLFIAAGIALAPVRTPLAELAHRAVAVAVVATAFLALVGLSFRVLLFYGVAPLFGMSLPTAVAFLLIGVSLLAGRPDAWLLEVLTSERPGAVISRWLLPAAIVVPLAAHWLQLTGQTSGTVDEPLGQAMLTLLTIAALGALTLWVAGELDRMSARSERAEREAQTQRESLQVVLASIRDGVIATDSSGKGTVPERGRPAAHRPGGGCGHGTPGGRAPRHHRRADRRGRGIAAGTCAAGRRDGDYGRRTGAESPRRAAASGRDQRDRDRRSARRGRGRGARRSRRGRAPGSRARDARGLRRARSPESSSAPRRSSGRPRPCASARVSSERSRRARRSSSSPRTSRAGSSWSTRRTCARSGRRNAT